MNGFYTKHSVFEDDVQVLGRLGMFISGRSAAGSEIGWGEICWQICERLVGFWWGLTWLDFEFDPITGRKSNELQLEMLAATPFCACAPCAREGQGIDPYPILISDIHPYIRLISWFWCAVGQTSWPPPFLMMTSGPSDFYDLVINGITGIWVVDPWYGDQSVQMCLICRNLPSVLENHEENHEENHVNLLHHLLSSIVMIISNMPSHCYHWCHWINLDVMFRPVSLDQTCRANPGHKIDCVEGGFLRHRRSLKEQREQRDLRSSEIFWDLRKDDLSNAKFHINQAVHWSMSNCQCLCCAVPLSMPPLFFARFRTDRPRSVRGFCGNLTILDMERWQMSD